MNCICRLHLRRKIRCAMFHGLSLVKRSTTFEIEMKYYILAFRLFLTLGLYQVLYLRADYHKPES